MIKQKPTDRICTACGERKPIDNFRYIGGAGASRHKKCKDCTNFVQQQMPYPILKQPSREWVLSELKRIKSIEHVKQKEL